MSETTVKALISFDTSNPDKIQSILGHHADYLIDMDENRDIINSVHGVISYDTHEKWDRDRIRILAEVINDLIGENEPDDAALDFDEDYIAMYAEMHNLKESLQKVGYL